ncbi:MAG: murein biosynthesis integral membrane protein MurJ [Clostridiales Family XIII bacterium]|nr:murein biosynthesis integral membrane protein MurJ [Clostridiales Family XIII bacterium]
MKSSAAITLVMMALTLSSKCIGFVREILMASYFGTSYVVDAYVMASNIPFFIFGGLLGALATAFIPTYSKIHEEEGKLHADLFMSRVINILLVASLIIAALGIIFSDQLIFVLAHGWVGNPDMQPAIDLAKFFVKIAFMTIFFSAGSEIFDAYQRYHHHYYTPIMTAMAYSISIIIFIVIAHHAGNRWLIGGLLAGFVLRFLLVGLSSRHREYRHKWDFRFTDTVKMVFILSAPVFVGSTIGQIASFVDKLMASWLPEGSISALNYSLLVHNLFVMIIGSMIAMYIYPKMARHFAAGEMSAWQDKFRKGLGALFSLSIPICLGCLLYNKQIIRLVYERNAFDAQATELTSTVFFYYAIGLALWIPMTFLVQAFYSTHDTKTPVIIGIICSCINVAGNLLMIGPFGIRGISLSTSIAVIINAIALIVILGKNHPLLIEKNFPKKIIKIICAAVCAIACSYPVHQIVLKPFPAKEGGIAQLVSLAAAAGAAVIVYLILMKLLKIEELTYIREMLPKRGDDPVDLSGPEL